MFQIKHNIFVNVQCSYARHQNASCVLAMAWASVCPSVCHTAVC